MACERKKTLETHLQVDIFKNIYTGRSEIILTTGLDRNSTEDVMIGGFFVLCTNPCTKGCVGAVADEKWGRSTIFATWGNALGKLGVEAKFEEFFFCDEKHQRNERVKFNDPFVLHVTVQLRCVGCRLCFGRRRSTKKEKRSNHPRSLRCRTKCREIKCIRMWGVRMKWSWNL